MKIVAFGAISALGRGSLALGVAEVGAPAKVAIERDDELALAGLQRPFAARVHAECNDVDRAAALLASALRDCAAALDRTRPGWRSERIGLALGTSSGGMRGAEQLFGALSRGATIAPEVARAATYFAPLSVVPAATGIARFAPATLVLTACAASTLALGLAKRWLEEDACDVVLAGGFDALSVFVSSGFDVLRATTASPPARPFGLGRDGLSVGEGAAIVALAKDGEPIAHLAGFGAASDASHLTAPHPEGVGLARAAEHALRDAEVAPHDVAWVNGHATSTPFNDASESKAITRALARSPQPIAVHALKAQIGHTMGAAGALETLACVESLARDVTPASASAEHLDESLGVELLTTSRAGCRGPVLKLSSAFGGANAALVVTREATHASARSRRDVFVGRAVTVDVAPDLAALADLVGTTVERLAKADGLSRLALTALTRLREAHGSLEGAGIVVGHALATLETNAAYFERVLARGPRSAEPRRFPATTPHAVAGECSVAFGLTGPGLAVGAGLHGSIEALAAAVDLVRAGDADRMVVVAVDEEGPATRALSSALGIEAPRRGATALLVSAAPLGYARIMSVERELAERAALDGSRGPVGHAALLPLAASTPPESVEARSDWQFYARARIGLAPQ